MRMTTSNQELTIDVLPQFEQQPQLLLSPTYTLINRWITVVTTAVFIMLITIVQFQPFVALPNTMSNLLMAAYPVVLVFGAINFTYTVLADAQKSYSLREQDLTFRSGLIFKKAVIQPILRVQHIELKRGPLERKYGLATLQVFSAGGVMHTFEIPGLPVATAQQIRQFILNHKDVAQHG